MEFILIMKPNCIGFELDKGHASLDDCCIVISL